MERQERDWAVQPKALKASEPQQVQSATEGSGNPIRAQ